MRSLFDLLIAQADTLVSCVWPLHVLGDAGPRAILEFVGKNDRVVKRSEKPDFGGAPAEAETAAAE